MYKFNRLFSAATLLLAISFSTITTAKNAELAQPINDRAIIGFAYEALYSVYSFNFAHPQNQLAKDSEEYFTRSGWMTLQPVLKDTINFELIKNQKMVGSPGLAGTPLIVDRGARNNIYTWDLQVPLIVVYENANTRSLQKVLLTIKIVRTADPMHVRGVAVDRVQLIRQGNIKQQHNFDIVQ